VPLGLVSLFWFNIHPDDCSAWVILLFSHAAVWSDGVVGFAGAHSACRLLGVRRGNGGLALPIATTSAWTTKKSLDVFVALTTGVVIYLVGRRGHLGDLAHLAAAAIPWPRLLQPLPHPLLDELDHREFGLLLDRRQRQGRRMLDDGLHPGQHRRRRPLLPLRRSAKSAACITAEAIIVREFAAQDKSPTVCHCFAEAAPGVPLGRNLLCTWNRGPSASRAGT